MTKPQPSPTIDPAALKAAQEALNNAPSGDAPGVDKIRELLFGNQMQDYDRRFSQLEERFQQKMRDIEAESARALQKHGVLDQEAAGIDSQPGPAGAGTARRSRQGIGPGLREQMQGWKNNSARFPTSWRVSIANSQSESATKSQGVRDDIRRRNDDTRATIERNVLRTEQRQDRSQPAGRSIRRDCPMPEPGHDSELRREHSRQRQTAPEPGARAHTDRCAIFAIGDIVIS